jgi:hypothetical protein
VKILKLKNAAKPIFSKFVWQVRTVFEIHRPRRRDNYPDAESSSETLISNWLHGATSQKTATIILT